MRQYRGRGFGSARKTQTGMPDVNDISKLEEEGGKKLFEVKFMFVAK